MNINPGIILDNRYRIVSLPRAGGMSLIYKAHDLKENRTVAIKVLKEDIINKNEAILRMKKEEEIGLLLDHRNIARIYPPPEERSFYYQVMEYIEGITLDEFILKHRRLTVKNAIYIILQLLDAIEHMHSKGVIHQDLKPQNILVVRGNEIKIIDFGLSYYRNSKYTLWKNLLAVGGTVAYMSPQRINGDISSECDVFSAGVIFYQMLTGRLPYTETELISFASNPRSKITPKKISFYNRHIHPKLEEIAMKSISLEKDSRFSTASAFGFAISRVAKQAIAYRKKEIDWFFIIVICLLFIAVFILIKLFLLFR
ncbi:MAG: serine/threonine protein kinase [Elusimicrobia bacterium]|nr:serine/threonine protein kinase [Elusimicrobiota bacterium]